MDRELEEQSEWIQRRMRITWWNSSFGNCSKKGDSK
jgi:hypothetical protein